MPHILFVSCTFEQCLHSSEQLNAYLLETKHTNVEIQKFVYLLSLTVENIGT